MSTYTNSTPIAGGSTANLNAFIEDVCNALFTECGVTQTTDTGQCWSPNTATATWSTGTNTSYGYVIGQFNDALQGTCPVFFRLDFGNGNTDLIPYMWITVGTGSNGSGTINGTTMTKVGCMSTTAPITGTNFASYFVYNSTYGVLGMAYKQGALSAAVAGLFDGGFYLFRGSTATGAANSDAVCLFTQLAANGGPYTGSVTGVQSISYSKSVVYPTTLTNASACLTPPLFGYEGAVSPDAPTIWPVFYLAPAPTISGVVGTVNCADVNVGTSFTASILGSTPLTFINLGGAFGSEIIGVDGEVLNSWCGISAVGTSLTSATVSGVAFLWQ